MTLLLAGLVETEPHFSHGLDNCGLCHPFPISKLIFLLI